MNEQKMREKGEDTMNAYAMKPKLPFATKGELKRTPASDSNKKMVEFMDSHNFSFSVDKNTGELRSTITPKK
ncbi:MAG: hypothetical protein IJ958_08635 [Agathobacter sp.]|nr:hypothetical protein [Agathobacter sp.]MBR2493863.1 hypothetical protein [Paludibacteraceae bacterium]